MARDGASWRPNWALAGFPIYSQFSAMARDLLLGFVARVLLWLISSATSPVFVVVDAPPLSVATSETTA